MSDTNAPEPTMEEILASIRRIISEDDAPAAKPAPAPATDVLQAALPPGPPPTPVHEAEPFHEPPEDDVLELTEPLSLEPEPSYSRPPAAYEPEPEPEPAPVFEPMGDLDFSPPSEPHPAPPAYAPPAYAPPAYAPVERLVSDHLVSEPAAGAAASHFGQLARSIAVPADGRTLEDVVVAVLRPMLKDWLDRYLAQIVEAKVQAEVERISRSNVH
jgi:cell pole-organizing protein PopZ